VTVTIGVAGRAKDEGGDALTARADLALYRGKDAGRNRVVVG
jgi:PleD family two-component response regulator